MMKHHVLPSVFVLMLFVFSSVSIAQETLVNEQPPEIIQPANWAEEIYWGFLDTIGIETPNEEQYREWKEGVESKILEQEYAVDGVKLVVAERTKDVVRVVSEPIYNTVFVKNTTFEGNTTEYVGTQLVNKTVNDVVESWQELVTSTETYIVPQDRVCVDQDTTILCVSVPHCLGRYTTTNVMSYVNAGCDNEVIPKNSLHLITQQALSPDVYVPSTMRTKKEILLSKDVSMIDKLLPQALVDDMKEDVGLSP